MDVFLVPPLLPLYSSTTHKKNTKKTYLYILWKNQKEKKQDQQRPKKKGGGGKESILLSFVAPNAPHNKRFCPLALFIAYVLLNISPPPPFLPQRTPIMLLLLHCAADNRAALLLFFFMSLPSPATPLSPYSLPSSPFRSATHRPTVKLLRGTKKKQPQPHHPSPPLKTTKKAENERPNERTNEACPIPSQKKL